MREDSSAAVGSEGAGDARPRLLPAAEAPSSCPAEVAAAAAAARSAASFRTSLTWPPALPSSPSSSESVHPPPELAPDDRSSIWE